MYNRVYYNRAYYNRVILYVDYDFIMVIIFTKSETPYRPLLIKKIYIYYTRKIYDNRSYR